MITGLSRERRLGVDHRYRPLVQLNEDHLGSVWTADDVAWHRTVSLRVIAESLASSESFMGRLATAIEELMSPLISERGIDPRILHPNAARPLGFDPGGPGSPPLIVMEPVSGAPLESFLDEIGRPSHGIIVGATLSIAGALHAAHQVGLVHGGVNPTNVLIDSEGTVKVLDFGVMAAWVSTPGFVDPQSSLAAYIAPELLAGEPPTTRSDAFSVAAILHSLLLGRPGLKGGTGERSPTRTPAGEIEGRIAELCQSILANDPTRRSHPLVDLMTELSALPIGSGATSPRVGYQEVGAADPARPAEALVEIERPVVPDLPRDQPAVRLLKDSSVEESLRSVVLARANHRRYTSSWRSDVVPSPPEESSRVAGPSADHRRHRRLIIAIVCIVVVLAAASIVSLEWGRAWIAHQAKRPAASASGRVGLDRAKPGSSKVVVPRLGGLTVTEALDRLQAVGLKVDSLKPLVGTPGIVRRSKPAAGKAVRRGTGVVLFVGVTTDRMKSSG